MGSLKPVKETDERWKKKQIWCVFWLYILRKVSVACVLIITSLYLCCLCCVWLCFPTLAQTLQLWHVATELRTENWDMKQVTGKQAIVLISPCDWFVIAVLFFSAQELNVSQNNPGITYNKVNAAEGKVRCTSLIPRVFLFLFEGEGEWVPCIWVWVWCDYVFYYSWKNVYNHVMSLPLVLVLLVQSTGHFLWPTF